MAETESHESVQQHVHPGWMAQREAELAMGRQKVEEYASNLPKEQRNRMLKEGDARLEEDLAQRERILDTSVSVDQYEHDRAGAEVIDQAQTALESIQHLADRAEPIIDFRRANRVERLEDPTVDVEEAEKLVADHITAQAVNQPTVLAAERGEETIGRPLNNTEGMFTDEELALATTPTPKDKHVPKTREQAEEIALGKVPPVEKVVKEAAIVSDEAIHRNEAIDIVRAADDNALSIDGEPETDPRSTYAESAFKKPPDARQLAREALEKQRAKRGRPRKEEGKDEAKK